jgi:Ca2+-transporting ATPase
VGAEPDRSRYRAPAAGRAAGGSSRRRRASLRRAGRDAGDDDGAEFIVWTLPANLGEGLVLLAAIFAGVAMPILPLQILWINMTTALLLGMTLAFEPKEPGLMNRPPRDPRAPILDRPLVGRIVLVGAPLLVGSFGLFEWELGRGASVAEARTVAVNVFIFGELMYLFNCRSLRWSALRLGLFSNRWLFAGVAAMTALQLIYTYTPFMNRLFHGAPISAAAWVRIVGFSLVIYGAVGVEKWLRRRSASPAAG